MSEKKTNMEQSSEQNLSKIDEAEIDLYDVLRRIVGVRKAIYKAAGIGLIIGVIIALSVPKEYRVQVTLSPEMGNSKGGNGLAGLAASFLGTGATMTEGMDALNASLSADIVSSTPFLLELTNMQVLTLKKDELALSSYLDSESLPWWSYIIRFPGMIIKGLKSLFIDEDEIPADNIKQGIIELNEEELERLKLLRNKIIASVDKKTAITSVSVTLQDPRVTAIVADSVIHKLQEYIIDYRTYKSEEDCAYLEKLFKERQQEYYDAQKKYANYVDSHDNLILHSVRTEQERLQNDMNLAYQVYSQIANQLQVARAKVQEEKPVFAIVEPAVVPLKPSSTGLIMYCIAFIFLSVFSVIIWKLIGEEIWNKFKNACA